VFVNPNAPGKSRLNRVGWAVLTGTLLGFFSPVLVVVPMLTFVMWRLLGGDRGSYVLAAGAALGGLVGVAFVIGDPGWLTDTSRRLGVSVGDQWPVLILIAAVPLFVESGRIRALALTGGLMSLGALAVVRLVPLGPGLEEAVLVLASFGAALATAAALDTFSRNVFRLVAAVGAILLIALSLTIVANGRLGFPTGDVNARLSFATTLAEEHGPGRVLHASIDRELIPGEVRSGPGFWYRVLDGTGTTNDEMWLPPESRGDQELAAALADITSGADLRPGARLASFAIDWVVLEGPEFRLDEVLVAQLDLVPIPLDPESRVFENLESDPIAGTEATPWLRSGTGYAGDEVAGPMPLAVNFDEGWGPDGVRNGWSVAVDGSLGSASHTPSGLNLYLAIASIVSMAGAVLTIVLGRRTS
jgi:hypothetical protein